ncbi:MAG: hypothetical protein ACOCXH_11575 [Cyclobacteriaceae bacterium]
MSYQYGKDVLNIKNPFKEASYLMLIRGAITLTIGIFLLLSIRDLMVAQREALSYITLAASLIILADGIVNLFNGMIKGFRFLVGREVPENLSFNYGSKKLFEMLEGRKNYTFQSPANFLEHFIISVYEGYLFLPPPLRRTLYQFIKVTYYSVLILVTYGIMLLTNYLGFTELITNNLLPWYTFLLLTYLFLIAAFNQPSGKRLYHPVSKNSDLIISIFVIIVAVVVPFISTTVIQLPPPPVNPLPFILLIISLSAIVSIINFFLARFRSKMIDPATDVSEFREHWTQNLHPQDIFRSFSHELENIRFKELPHRHYIDLKPKLSMEGSMDKGSYEGDILLETQPYSKKQSLPDMMVKLRLGAAILGHIIGIVASFVLFFSVKNLEVITINGAISLFLSAFILFISSSYFTKLALQYWAEVTFESYLIYLKLEGTYTESTISTGKAIYDSTSSENKLVRSSITSLLLISRIFTSTLAGGQGKNLMQERYVLTMEKADDMQNLLINGIKKFMSEKEVIATIASRKDKENTAEIHKLNVEQRKNILLNPEKEIGKFNPEAGDLPPLPPPENEK